LAGLKIDLSLNTIWLCLALSPLWLTKNSCKDVFTELFLSPHLGARLFVASGRCEVRGEAGTEVALGPSVFVVLVLRRCWDRVGLGTKCICDGVVSGRCGDRQREEHPDHQGEPTPGSRILKERFALLTFFTLAQYWTASPPHHLCVCVCVVFSMEPWEIKQAEQTQRSRFLLRLLLHHRFLNVTLVCLMSHGVRRLVLLKPLEGGLLSEESDALAKKR